MRRTPARRARLLGAILAAAVVAVAAAQQRVPIPRYVKLDEVKPLLSHPSLPAAIRNGSAAAQAKAFDAWIRTRDREIRQRVQRGAEEALVPLLLFGTSYTAAPRLTRGFLDDLRQRLESRPEGAAEMERTFGAIFERRTDDLLAGLAAPGGNPRLAWALATVERAGHTLRTSAGRAAVGRFLVELFARVTRDSAALSAGLVGGSGTPTLDRAHAFATRALAPDSTWPINFALRDALSAPGVAGAASPLRRLAIVGPGLDVIDKDEGFDLHPPQSLQPFALIDATVDLGLAALPEISVLTIDLNPDVNAHLAAARAAKRPYVVHLLANDRPWTDAARSYWAAFGRATGAPATAASPTASAVRAVRFPADVAQRLIPVDGNIVYQRLDLADSERVDLVVATNVLLYYDDLEQLLALANIEHLLRPGGILLTNTQLPALPAGLVATGRTLSVFSSRPGDGEVVYAYSRRQP